MEQATYRFVTGATGTACMSSGITATPEEILEMRLTGGAATWSGFTTIWGGRNDTNTNTDGRQTFAARKAILIFGREYFP